MDKITQAQFIDGVARRSTESLKTVECIIKAAAEEIKSYAKNGVIIPFPGLGKFVPHDAPERTGRNPKTGEEHKIPAKRVLKFKVSSTIDINPTEMQRRIEELG